MRRKDREITDKVLIDEIILRSSVARLGFVDGKKSYIVPLNFGYDGKYLYFHSAKEGRKVDLIKKTHYASFELDNGGSLKCSENACDYSFYYESVIGDGTIEVLETHDDKLNAMLLIMKHYTDNESWHIPEEALNGIFCFRLKIGTMSAKRHE